MDEVPFGADVEVCAKLVRQARSEADHRWCKYWARRCFEKSMSVGGILIGWRTLRDGDVGDGNLGSFVTEKSFRVALVVLNGRDNPIYVHCEDIVGWRPRRS